MSESKFIPSLRFAVMSDLHVKEDERLEEERFHAALKYAYSIARSSDDYKKLDAIVIVGDFANHGTEIEMTKVRDALNANVDRDETDVIMSFASHESGSSVEGNAAAAEKMKRILDQDSDQHKVINGFHFVSISPSRKCDYNEDKQKWMAAELDKAVRDDRKKPIFVFQHPHNSATVYGSILWGTDDLIHVYMNYPQIIHFSGHSHAPINDPRSIHQKHFTSLGTGTLRYLELDEFDKIYGTVPPKSTDVAQFLIVEVAADNRVRVYPFDVLTGNFFPMVHKIDTPSDPESFTYTDERYKTAVAPYFTDDAEIRVTEAGENSIKFEFDQAKSDTEYVNSYDITLKDTEGFIIRHLSIWSEYYFYDMPKTLCVELDGLDSGTEYSIEIKADGFWNNRSENSLKASVKTL